MPVWNLNRPTRNSGTWPFHALRSGHCGASLQLVNPRVHQTTRISTSLTSCYIENYICLQDFRDSEDFSPS